MKSNDLEVLINKMLIELISCAGSLGCFLSEYIYCESVHIIHLLKLSFRDGLFVFMAHFSYKSPKTHLTNMITQGYKIKT